MKWFQNHSYMQRKAPKKQSSVSINTQDSDDEEAVQSHFSELRKELNKKKQNDDKLTRLLSLTYGFRKKQMLSQPANTRITSALEEISCLNKPIHVRH